MAYFIEKNSAIVRNILAFPAVLVSTAQVFLCKNLERAGFQIVALPQSDGTTLYVSAVYDYTNGAPVLLGTVSVVPGTDLCGGMFSSGCWCDRDPLAEGAAFYLVDYV